MYLKLCTDRSEEKNKIIDKQLIYYNEPNVYEFKIKINRKMQTPSRFRKLDVATMQKVIMLLLVQSI